MRQKLLANLNSMGPDIRSLKPSDRHGIAAAKKEELSKMARALGTRSDYTEGEAFDREKQEELRLRRMAEREEKDRQRDEERGKHACANTHVQRMARDGRHSLERTIEQMTLREE